MAWISEAFPIPKSSISILIFRVGLPLTTGSALPDCPATKILSLPTDFPASENGRRCGTARLGIMSWGAASRRDWPFELGAVERSLLCGDDVPMLIADRGLERPADTSGAMKE